MAWLLAARLLAQESERWEPWLEIPSEIAMPRERWVVPPAGRESPVAHPVPVPLRWDRPFIGGRLLLRRGAVIEAWDVDSRRRVWKLPAATGLVGWTIEGRRLTDVLPGGPAERAGLRSGDVLVLDDLPHFRAGEKCVFQVESAGGRRTVMLVPDPAPEPFGKIPELSAIIEEDLLISRDGRIERVRVSDGCVVWSVRGYVLAADATGVVLHVDRCVALLDADTGALRWRRDAPKVWRAWWSPRGPLVLLETRDGNAIELWDAGTGATVWNYASPQYLDRLELVAGRRVFVVTRDSACMPHSLLGGVPEHHGPTCLDHALLDLENGRVLWRARTGGRNHGGTHRMEPPKYIPFDPHAGGPGTVAYDRLFWFDVKSEELSVLDPMTLREYRRVKATGAKGYSGFAPPGQIGLDMGSSTYRWVDPVSGSPREMRFPPEADVSLEFSAMRVFAAVRVMNKDLNELRAYDWSADPPRLLWTRKAGRHWWGTFSVHGDRVLFRDEIDRNDLHAYAMLDAGSGKELWSLDSPDPTYWRGGNGGNINALTLRNGFLLLSTTFGVRVFRRDR